MIVFNSFCIVTLWDQCTVRGKAKERNQEANRIWPTADRHWWHQRENGFMHKWNCGILHSAHKNKNKNNNKAADVYQKIRHFMNAYRNLSPGGSHAVGPQGHTPCFRHNKYGCIFSEVIRHKDAESQVPSFVFKHLLETVLEASTTMTLLWHSLIYNSISSV